MQYIGKKLQIDLSSDVASDTRGTAHAKQSSTRENQLLCETFPFYSYYHNSITAMLSESWLCYMCYRKCFILQFFNDFDSISFLLFYTLLYFCGSSCIIHFQSFSYANSRIMWAVWKVQKQKHHAIVDHTNKTIIIRYNQMTFFCFYLKNWFKVRNFRKRSIFSKYM